MIEPIVLFPFAEYWWFYTAFVGVVLVLITVDLGLFQQSQKAVSFRGASYRTLIWIALALLFNIFLYQFAIWEFTASARLNAIPGFNPQEAASNLALEFLTGYVVEQSLSVDNIFIFVVVFMYFGIPPKYQHRVLFYGILGALVLRGVFIALGSYLMHFHIVIILFGIFLLFTGVHMMFAPDKKIEPDKNRIIRLLKRFIPLSKELDGKSFFVRHEGKLHMTPLFVALVFLELTDVVFAVDSVPAIFAITNEPLVVFTSNICAILGLRSLYFLLAGAIDIFRYLKYGLSVVLIFVGLKMVWLDSFFGGKFPIVLSLIIIVGVIGLSIIASLIIPRREKKFEQL